MRRRMCCSSTWHCRTCREPCSAGVCEPAHRSPRYWRSPPTRWIFTKRKPPRQEHRASSPRTISRCWRRPSLSSTTETYYRQTPPFETAENAYDRIRSTPADPLTTLTFNEMKALNLASRGLSSKEIAKQMKVTPVTVRTYTLHARTKLGAATLGEALVKWQRAKHV